MLNQHILMPCFIGSQGNLTMAAQVVQEAAAAAAPTFSKPTLLDVPISNNGARCRYVMYKKRLENVIDIQSPKVLGGLKAEPFLERNPLGKMPVLLLPDGTSLPESAVIASYLVDKYQGPDYGASFALDTPEDCAHDHLVQRVHDIYICSIQGCMYRDMDAAQRAKDIATLAFQLDVLNGLIKGPYVNGSKLGLADAALFPTLTFCRFMLAPFFGWAPIFDSRPALGRYWATMEADEDAARVIGELEGALEGWKEAGRWQEKGILEQVASKQHKWAY